MYKLLQPNKNKHSLCFAYLRHNARRGELKPEKKIGNHINQFCTQIRGKTAYAQKQYPLIITTVCNSGHRVEK